MASGDNFHDSSTQKIFDYCEKYSQNANLPKYFSGSSRQHLPLIDMPIERNHQNKNTKSSLAVEPQVKFSIDEKISVCPQGKTTLCSKKVYEKESGNTESPDIKKLERDNEAEIGFNITENDRKVLCKCVSLPILVAPYLNTTSVNDCAKVLCSSTPNSVLSSDESLNQELNSTQSSSCICKTSRESPIESPSNSESEESKLLDFRKTLSYLRTKIGLPVAHSSPNLKDIDDIPEFKTTVSYTHEKLNENNLKIKEVKSGVNEFLFPCVVTTEVAVHKKNQPLFSESNPENGQVSFPNIEKKNITESILNKSNKKVIELAISKPIIIDWTKEELNTGHTCIPTFYSKSKAVHIPKEYSDCSSNCDSFEYIGNRDGNTMDIKCTRDQNAQQQSQNKNGISNSGKLYHFNLSSAKNPQDKDSCSSSSGLKSFSEDIKKQIDILQKLLKSKGVHLNKKRYIKKLFKSISDGECRVEHSDSSSETCDSNNSSKDCTVPSKKMGSCSTVGKNTISSSEASCANTKKSHEQSFTENLGNPDYLLQFAENERAYQINWIDNEILHLTKLKTILELKNSKNNYKTSFQRQPIKTSIYKIMQQDSNSNESEREYVIKTKFDVSTSKRVNYCFQGKKYSISDCTVPSTNANSNDKFCEKSMSADIKMQANDKQTSITVSDPSFCKRKSCYSEVDIPESLGINIRKRSTNSKLHVPNISSKICPVCQELKCICKQEQIRPLELPSIPGSDSPEYFNSLEKIFRKCNCTVENNKCQCIFVKKLLNHLLSTNDVSSSSSDVKTESLFNTNSIGLLPPDNKPKEKYKKNEFEKIWDKPNIVNISSVLQPSSDPQLDIPETDRSHFITPEKHLFNDGNPTKEQHIVVGYSELIETDESEPYGVHLKEAMPADIVVDDTFKTSYVYNVNSQNKTMDSAKIVLTQGRPNIQQNANNEGGIKIVDHTMNSTLKSDTKYLDMKMYDNGSIAKTEENNIRSVSKSNITYKDIGVQAIENLLTAPGHPNPQDKITDGDGVARIEDSSMHSTLKSNKEYRNNDVQAIGNFLTEIENSNKQDDISNKEKLIKENDYIVHSDQINSTNYTDISVQNRVDSNTKINYLNQQQNKTTNKDVIISPRDNGINLALERPNSYKDIGIQASDGLRASSQTDRNLFQQNETTNKEGMISLRDNGMNLALKRTNSYKDIGIQASDGLRAGSQTDANLLQQNKTTSKDVMISPRNIGINLASERTNSYRDVEIHSSVGLRTSSQTDRNLLQQNKTTNKDVMISPRDNGINLASERTNSYRDIGIQSSVGLRVSSQTDRNLLQQNETNKEVMMSPRDNGVNLASERTNLYKDIGIQASDRLRASSQTDRNLLQQNETTNKEVLISPRDNGMNLASERTNSYKDIGIQASDGLRASSQIDRNLLQQNKTTNKDVLISRRDNGINLVSERTNSYKDIGIQASDGLKASSQTDRNLLLKNRKKGANHEGNRNNEEKKLSIESNGNKHKLPKQKDLLVDKTVKNMDEVDTDVPNNGSNKMAAGHSISTSPNSRDSNKEATSNETVAKYSQEGTTSDSISASVFDSQSVPSARLPYACCNKNAFVGEVCYQYGNASYAPYCRCYCNTLKPFYNVCYGQHRHILCQQLLKDKHTSKRCQICNSGKPKKTKGAVIPQGVAYTLTLQEPRSEKKTTDNAINENDKENDNKNILREDPFNKDQGKKRISENNDASHPEQMKKKEPEYTLGDYLNMNRPQFIYSAENRRQIVLNSRILREHQKDILKLHFLENNMNSITDTGQYKLFTEREMRNITRKNYQKLPETQRKLTILHQKRLRDADKLIRNTFAQKVQKCALKGQWNFPIDKTVTDLLKK